MISERQHEANRRNAAKSHGPITPEGRAAVRHNALKHGLTAAEIILPTVEEKIDFEQFRFAFEEEYKPQGPTEQVLVEDMVAARWRINRVRKMEPGFFALRLKVLEKRIKEDYSTLDAQAHLALILRDDTEDYDVLGKLSRYEARLERSFYKALKELQRVQALRNEVSDSENGTVSQSPVSPQPEATTQASARATDPVVPADIEPPVPTDSR